MSRSRPCRICRTWFRPDPRAGPRQHVCPEKSCQQERHRRSCKAWHDRNPGYDAESRLRRKLQETTVPAISDPLSAPALQGIDLDVARDAVGPQTVAVLEVMAQVLWKRTRDAVVSQRVAGQGVRGKVLPNQRRDEIADRSPPS